MKCKKCKILLNPYSDDTLAELCFEHSPVNPKNKLKSDKDGVEEQSAEEFLFSKYPLVSKEWFKDNELTQEIISMMEQYHKDQTREELVRFCDTFNMNDTSEQVVDEYLKNK